MTTWLSNFRRSFSEAVRDLLWRQWSSLGVPGAAGETGDWIVDPEALLISTMQFGRYDPRLFDATLDWCLANGKWISTTRLRWLRKDLTNDETRILSATVSVLASHDRSAKWTGVRRAGEKESGLGPPIPLFLTPDASPLPQGTEADPVFLEHGLRRPPWERGRVASKLILRKPAALRLRMRALFGIGSRAEILLFLLTHRSAHPRLVARQINHAQPPVARAMAEMAQAGFLTEQRTTREVEYTLNRQAWRSFLEVREDLGWANWGLIFRALRRIWACVQETSGRPVTAAILGSQLGTCVEQVSALLHESELGVVFETTVPGQPEDYVAKFEEGARKLFRLLETQLTGVQPQPR